jgi:hypothetical protein
MGAAPLATGGDRVSLLRDFGRFWWDFIVGDEWRIAVIVSVVTALGGLAAHGHWVDGEVLAGAVAVAVMGAVCAVLIATGRRLPS